MELLGDVGHVESHFSPFGDSVSVGARLVHGLRQTYHGSKTILVLQMVLLGDEAQMKAWSVWRQCLCQRKIGARFAPNVPSAQKSFWTHPLVLLGDARCTIGS